VRIGFPTTSLATIYKTIALLKDIGEISELRFKDDSNRYDGRQPSPHPHLVCRECNRILDVEIADLTGFSEQLERSSGFDRIMPRLDFFGICPDCQRNS
jgi:Fur family peroxide stress response transcriptional regulator